MKRQSNVIVLEPEAKRVRRMTETNDILKLQQENKMLRKQAISSYNFNIKLSTRLRELETEIQHLKCSFTTDPPFYIA
jgi:hypothetical protein